MSIKPLFDYDESRDEIIIPELQLINDTVDENNCMIEAKSDSQAIKQFLTEYKDSHETLRSYMKEIERLLLWCMHIGQVSISDIRRNHLTDYLEFLKKPNAAWCAPATKRYLDKNIPNPKWRPFVKGLSGTSIKKATKILDSFFNYLVLTNYLIGNPLAMEKRRKRKAPEPRIIDRYLTLEELNVTLEQLHELECQTAEQLFQKHRAIYIILLLFYSGMRISEAANHTMGHFIEREACWFLQVVGKGKKRREIPIPDELKQALMDFRKSIGLTPTPLYKEETPLIPMHNLKDNITPRRIDQILREAFNLGALVFDHNAPQKASKLRKASAHWLRHSYVTYLLETGAPLKVAQENAGHSDVSTTMLYRHVAQTDRFEATKNLSIDMKKYAKEDN